VANELKHGTVGTELTQTEWEAVGAHVLDGQATGDLIYASSASQLSRLAAGAADKILIMSGGVPVWSSSLASPVLTTPQINDVSADHQYIFAVSELAADRTVTLPLLTGNATFSFINFAETISAIKTHSADIVLNDNVNLGLGTSSGEGTIRSDGSAIKIGSVAGKDIILGDDNEVMRISGGDVVIFGSGEGGTTVATGKTIRAPDVTTGGAGNIAGADLTIIPGLGTGTGDVGQIIFRAVRVAASGDNIQTLNTAFVVDDDGTNPVLDLQGTTTLLNVGNADNEWVSTAFTHKGTGASKFERSGTVTNGISTALQIQLTTSNDIADGFAPAITFQIEDAGVTNQAIGQLLFSRQGADNTGRFALVVNNSGAMNEGLRLSAPGVLSVDLAGTGTAAQVDLFDDYDDALELHRFAHSIASVTPEQRDANRARMVEMGILEAKDTGSGYLMHIQPLTRLLAGGIYQNRAHMNAGFDLVNIRVDEHETRFSTVEDRVGALEGALEEALEILRAQVVALGRTPEA